MNEKTKESKFLDAINQYAKRQAAIINGEVEEYKQQKVEQATESGLQDAYNLIKRNIAQRKANLVTEYAQKENDLRTSLFRERRRITEEVFSIAEKKLLEYTESEEYKTDILESARKAAEIIGGSSCKVFIKESDIGLAEPIKGILFSASTESDSDIRIGGIKILCEARGILLDDTLDSRLEDQRIWFAEHSGLKVV